MTFKCKKYPGKECESLFDPLQYVYTCKEKCGEGIGLDLVTSLRSRGLDLTSSEGADNDRIS